MIESLLSFFSSSSESPAVIRRMLRVRACGGESGQEMHAETCVHARSMRFVWCQGGSTAKCARCT